MGLPQQNRVAVYHSNTDIRLETRPVQAPGDGELLIEVGASGICGSDVMEWYRRPRAPAVLGHEVAGRIVAAGENTRDFQEGDRVVASHHVPCMVCRYCLSGRETVCDTLRQTNFDPGGFAEFIRIPGVNVERGVLKLPPHMSDDAGSLVEPLGCVLRGHRKAAFQPGQTVLIIGAGVSGCLHLLAARALGASLILVSELAPPRRALAERLGADRVLDARESVGDVIRGELGHGVDRVVVCTGARPAIDQALHAVDRGGTVLFFAPMGPDQQYGLPFDSVFWRNDVTLASSYGAGLVDLVQALDLIAADRVNVGQLVTHRIPLAQVQHGFAMMLEAGDSLKIIVDPRLD
jgi:L-iditol 2-dehydrogenase